ncbi:uncharacterized protein G2W53_010414 [Senna tora]|uniref:Uncharacterized protein n=1 Tax=Senna tora TaxID=362788 RepID=A0A834X0N0_9FABA|nr:uncharacterized protein G2W53_010414 [Senna tora]
MGVMIAWKVCEVMYKHVLNSKSRSNLKRIQVQVKRVVALVGQTNRFALCLGI